MNALRTSPFLLIGLAACNLTSPPEGLAPTEVTGGPALVFDLDALPLPEIPFPNDLATRIDPSKPTGRALNISLRADTEMERDMRSRANDLDGFGSYSPIWMRFDAPLDLCAIADAHHADEAFDNDVIYLVDTTTGEAVQLDMNRGFFPYLLPGNGNGDTPDRVTPRYYPMDPGAGSSSLILDDREEDSNGNGVLDPGEDVDGDGHLDTRAEQALPACSTAWRYPENVIYESQTNTLQVRPIRPLKPATTYAVVVTKRLKGVGGKAVQSPFAGINHPRQTGALQGLLPHLASGTLGIGLEDVAYTWTFTTSSAVGDLFAIREGIAGAGPFAWLEARFPAELDTLHQLVDDSDPAPPFGGHMHLINGDKFATLLTTLERDHDLGLIGNDAGARSLIGSLQNINYMVSGAFKSPNFLVDRDGVAGTGCPTADGAPATAHCQQPDDDDEVFELNRVNGTAVVGETRVPFWCAIPQERYRRGDKPFPVSFYGHGYTSSRFEMLGFAGFHARMGVATCAIESFGHGLTIPPLFANLISSIAAEMHGAGMIAAVTDGRARDLTNDGVANSGGDFWTADTFHTRDAVRQSVVDWMTLGRILRGFDGSRTWKVPVGIAPECEGQPNCEDPRKTVTGMAGDFDGDGKVDLGGPDSEYFAWGQSLGGILSGVYAGVEPTLTAAAPTAGSGGLFDVGVRSTQGGVKQGVHLRFMGLIVVGLPGASGEAEVTRLQFIASNVNDDVFVPFGELPPLTAGDTVRMTNHTSGTVVETLARPYGNAVGFRLHMPASAMRGPQKRRLADLFVRDGLIEGKPVDPAWIDQGLGDRLTLEVLGADGALKATVDQFGETTNSDGDTLRLATTCLDSDSRSSKVCPFQGLILNPGTPLHAVAMGTGKYRSTPNYRRFIAIAATVLEGGDPAVFAPHYFDRPHDFSAIAPNAAPGTAVLVIPTAGDMNVPVNTGIAMATAAHIVPITEAEDPARYAHYGRSPGQAMADAFVMESVIRKRRWTVGEEGARPTWTADNNAAGIVFDIDDLDLSRDAWNEPDFAELGALCAGDSGHLSCRYPWPCGAGGCAPLRLEHGHPDGRRSALRVPVVAPQGDHGFLFPDPAARLGGGFDIDGFMVNLVGWFFHSGGKELPLEVCMNVVPGTVQASCVRPRACTDDASNCATDEDCAEGVACVTEIEGLCSAPAGADPVVCTDDAICQTTYPLGIPDPTDPAYSPLSDEPASVDTHVCSWIAELGGDDTP
jgi:hypothetical protein